MDGPHRGPQWILLLALTGTTILDLAEFHTIQDGFGEISPDLGANVLDCTMSCKVWVPASSIA